MNEQEANNEQGRLLQGKKELLAYFEEKGCNLGPKALDSLIQVGLPGMKIGTKLYFHSKNVDEFLLRATRQRVHPNDEIEDE